MTEPDEVSNGEQDPSADGTGVVFCASSESGTPSATSLVRYVGVLSSASRWRKHVVPRSNDDMGHRQQRPSEPQGPPVTKSTDVSCTLAGLPEALSKAAEPPSATKLLRGRGGGGDDSGLDDASSPSVRRRFAAMSALRRETSCHCQHHRGTRSCPTTGLRPGLVRGVAAGRAGQWVMRCE